MERPWRSAATKRDKGFWVARGLIAEFLRLVCLPILLCLRVSHAFAPQYLGPLFFSTTTELEASRSDLGAARTVIAQLPPGLVKRRMEAALKGVDDEIQSQLWGHLRSKSGGGGGTTGQRAVASAAPAAAVRRKNDKGRGGVPR